MTGFSVPTLDELRRRRSIKWSQYDDSVLPLWVAEMDYTVATPIRDALAELVASSDLGYAETPGGIGPAFSSFAEERWGWPVDPAGVRTTTDVVTGIVEVLRRAIRPGDGVIVTPPVYAPFFQLVPEAGGRVVEVPLVRADGAGDAGRQWDLDIDGIEAALASGEAVAVLVSNPHNPLGTIPQRAAELAAVAARHGAIVVSDEIHAPLVHSGRSFTPFLALSDQAREVGVCVTSASKAWNLAGTKCAVMVAGSARTQELLDGMYDEVGFRTSILGLHASIAAYEHGAPWLEAAVAEIEASSARLARLVAERLPGVVYEPPAASYLAWLDFRALPGWGEDPSARALERGVAINAGPTFGAQGRGFARLNFACSAEVLTEAIGRLGRD